MTQVSKSIKSHQQRAEHPNKRGKAVSYSPDTSPSEWYYLVPAIHDSSTLEQLLGIPGILLRDLWKRLSLWGLLTDCPFLESQYNG